MMDKYKENEAHLLCFGTTLRKKYNRHAFYLFGFNRKDQLIQEIVVFNVCRNISEFYTVV
jgi:hypothetical protein